MDAEKTKNYDRSADHLVLISIMNSRGLYEYVKYSFFNIYIYIIYHKDLGMFKPLFLGVTLPVFLFAM